MLIKVLVHYTQKLFMEINDLVYSKSNPTHWDQFSTMAHWEWLSWGRPSWRDWRRQEKPLRCKSQSPWNIWTQPVMLLNIQKIFCLGKAGTTWKVENPLADASDCHCWGLEDTVRSPLEFWWQNIDTFVTRDAKRKEKTDDEPSHPLVGFCTEEVFLILKENK